MEITKEIQWDMGHRVTNHKSKCKNLHGHRYELEVTLQGNIVTREGVSDEGMVIDFGDIKQIMTSEIHDLLDHSFMIWEKDTVLTDFFSKNHELKHVKVTFVPTAENIAQWIFKKLKDKYVDKYSTNLLLKSVKLWETPTSFVTYYEE